MSYDAEATRRRIFDAATAEFAAHGLAGARVERIATAARANKQAIYLYFGGKDKLFGAVVRAKLEEICHSVELGPATLAESAGMIFDWYREHPELVRLLLWEALELGGGALPGEQERRLAYEQNVRDMLAYGHGDGLPEAERARDAQDWLFTVLGLIAWNFAVPQMRRLILAEPDEEAALARRRAIVVDTVRALAERRAGAR
ncbi:MULTISPECIES: TetR family transcriptional regulator [Actinomadura]|uniref:TetR family transcriptional regulator n=1 Tax=Actinomadura yumaensis TaxID=111807 RepID=A0ABW2CYJ8_9ACTN|nr:TetR family transcriptional regulator [Actinomadura sp. J1-007]MWK37406.1 TetR family transcriptional regulator [Actinomadura sp. J1-007]